MVYINCEHGRKHARPSQAPSSDKGEAVDTASTARPRLHLATINAGSSSKEIPAFLLPVALANTLLELSREEST